MMSANQGLVIMMSYNYAPVAINLYYLLSLNNLAQIIRFEVQTLTPLYFKVTSFLLLPL